MTSQWARWRLKSSASPLFTQPLIQRRPKKYQSSASLAFVIGEFSAQMASNAENVSILWCHHVETRATFVKYPPNQMSSSVNLYIDQ